MDLLNVQIDPEISQLIPNGRLGTIEAIINPSHENMKLLEDFLAKEYEEFCSQTIRDEIKLMPAITSTRIAYKRLGKDPNRYRPAAEQLLRRASANNLYRINPIVDLGNYIAMKSGYSLGVFDRTSIKGNIILRRGRAEDAFEGIGRGQLNIEGLPTYVDMEGPFATPTSDCLRTSVKKQSKHILFFINDFGSANPFLLQSTMDEVEYFLSAYFGVEVMSTNHFDFSTHHQCNRFIPIIN